MLLKKEGKKAQVTLFIVLAIVIVVISLLAYFYILKIQKGKFPEAEKVEKEFLECIKTKTKEGIKIASLHGGWIELPEFDPGSDFMPFSNYFFFLGMRIPYWYYISGNNLEKWQIPEKEQIEKQLISWLEKEIIYCKPEVEGVEIYFHGKPDIEVLLYDNKAKVNVFYHMEIKKANTTTILKEHKTSIPTNFYSLYKDARKIFDEENSSFFLENYTIDVLNLYAPTTRVEISCAPKRWSKQEVAKEIKTALEANIPMIKFRGDYYKLKKEEHKYFVINVPVKNNINLLYSKNWPTKFEVWPSEQDSLEAYPLGDEPGLQLLGFCILTYHFVYDLAFPVLFQISKNDEIFQFPVVVYVQKNRPRKAETEEAPIFSEIICKNRAQIATVFTYDEDSRPLEAEIFFKCFDQVCKIGKTKIEEGKARITERFPECVNGLLIARAPGFEDAKIVVSSNEPFVENLFLEKNYELELSIDLQVNERAIVSFEGKNKKLSLFYPEQKKVSLASGTYNITVILFKETNLKLEKQKGEKCISIPSGGLGLPFVPRTECFELEIPETTLTEVPVGGGSLEASFTKQELARAKKIKISPEKFFVPSRIEDLTEIYELIKITSLQIRLE